MSRLGRYIWHLGRWFLVVFLTIGAVYVLALGLEELWGWQPTHTLELVDRLTLPLVVGLVSLFLPSPLHAHHVRIPRITVDQLSTLIVRDLAKAGVIGNHDAEGPGYEEVIERVNAVIEDLQRGSRER